MSSLSKITIVLLLATAVGLVLVLKGRDSERLNPATATACWPTGERQLLDVEAPLDPEQSRALNMSSAPIPGPAAEVTPRELPRLVELGADKCIPCKMMAPILAKLKTDFADKLEVEFIDVWKNPEAGITHGVDVIPTQIFYAASGEELHRHTGFIGREDILATWSELGIPLGPGPDK